MLNCDQGLAIEIILHCHFIWELRTEVIHYLGFTYKYK